MYTAPTTPQMLQNILNTRKQQASVSPATMAPLQNTTPTSYPLGGDSFSIGDLHDISKTAGYDPKTLFGTPLSTVVNSTSQNGSNGALGQLMNSGNVGNMMTQGDPESQAAMNFLKGIGNNDESSNKGSASDDSSDMSSGDSGDSSGGGDDSMVMGNM